MAIFVTNGVPYIHKNNYVHSDVRIVNVAISSDGESAALIDFDLANRVDTKYPRNFNHWDIPECHPAAKGNKQRQKIHDVHALNVLVQKYSEIKVDLAKVKKVYRKSDQ